MFAIGGVPPALRRLYVMRELQHEAALRLFGARYRGLPGKVREAAV